MIKKKYKCMVLILIALFITGCDFKYEMSITHNTVKEKVTLSEENSENINSFLEVMDSMMQEYENTSKGKFDIQKKIGKNQAYYTFGYKESLSSLKNSDTLSILKGCYDKVDVLDYENKYLLSTSPEFLCYEYYSLLENGTIDIYTDHQVTFHNADEVKDSHYIWHINKENAKERAIQLEFAKNKYNNSGILNGLKALLIGVGVILSVLAVGAGYIYIKHKRVNKI